MPSNVLSQPKQNPVASPVSSLEGTMTTPPPVDVGGIQLPADYAALLGQQAPAPTQEGPGGTDYLLGILGGLLSGNPGAIFGNVMETRARARDVEVQNQKAMQDSAKARADLLMKGMTQRREDALKPIEEKIKELKQTGDVEAVDRARGELTQRERGLDLDARRNQLEQAEFRLMQKEKELTDKGDKEEGENLNHFHTVINDAATQLETQLRRGDPEPTIRVQNPITGDMEEVTGLANIQSVFDRELISLTQQLAVEDRLDMREVYEDSFNQILQPLLDEWTTKKVEGIKARRPGIEAAREKYARQAQGKGRVKEPRKTGRVAPMPANIQPYR
jgi:hypothetical protein